MAPEPDRRVAFETARLALARTNVDSAEAHADVTRHALRMCAQALDVERVGFWTLEADKTRLVCQHMYTKSSGQHTSGQVLYRATMRTYLDALEKRRVIVADVAYEDPCTSELKDVYLAPLGITSMLDAPVFRQGQSFGVLCHEHVGAPRKWTQNEIEFASSSAEVMALVYEQAERMNLEAQLRSQGARLSDMNRLEQLGRLVGAISHDFSTVLTAMQFEASRLRREGHLTSASAIDDCAQLGGRLITELRDFGDGTRVDREATVGEMVDGIRKPVDLLVRDRADLTVKVDEPSARIRVPRLHLEQILLNLCMNARDAIERRGLIELSVTSDPAWITFEVRDDGAGMPGEVQAHIFEPFYTTKSTGTGLGLATVADLVESHGGHVDVDSEVGKGTRFRVKLPRVQA